MKIPRYILPIIVIAQFCCTSLWFASNAVMGDLLSFFKLPESSLANLTAVIQFGFICGTLVFALLSIADRYSPSKVFLVCAVLGACSNWGITISENTLEGLLFLRFLTGFFLAGIYPVGMKIAADYYNKGLGKSLGYLVGALVLGTAFPHALKVIAADFEWQYVVYATSGIALLGGIMIAVFVADGPYRKAQLKQLDFSNTFQFFKNASFRSAALGYFGHMWELYAFWTFVPVILHYWQTLNNTNPFNLSLWSFIIIASGSLGCIVGGYLAQRFGEKRIAASALFLSGICCLLSPLIFQSSNFILIIFFLLIWGITVIADSPLFSTLVARSAEPETKGTALTIVNCIGFSITIISIQLLRFLEHEFDPSLIYLILAIGPIIGLVSLLKTKT